MQKRMTSYGLTLTILCLSLILSAGLLTACGETAASELAQKSYDYLLEVELLPEDTREIIEKRYNATAVSWRPEAGFAVLGVYEQEISSLHLGADPNRNTVIAPEFTMDSAAFWAGKYRAWSSGWTAWTDGRRATTFEENLATWDQIRLPQARALSPNGGAGVKVAVIDTGIDLYHPAFIGKFTAANEWKDFVDGDRFPQDERGFRGYNAGYGHGTAIAGIIVQVAPNVSLLPIRALTPEGSGDLSHVIAALDWAVEQDADIINLSLGTNDNYDTLQRIVDYTLDKEVYIVASSGNSGDTRVTYPAAKSDTGNGNRKNWFIGVGSVDKYDRKSPFSTYGDNLELVAPGEDIYTVAPGRKRMSVSGTSAAAAVVSGALALGLALEYDAADEYTKLAEHINSAAVDVSYYNPDIKLGFGRIDVREYLEKAQPLNNYNPPGNGGDDDDDDGDDDDDDD